VDQTGVCKIGISKVGLVESLEVKVRIPQIEPLQVCKIERFLAETKKPLTGASVLDHNHCYPSPHASARG
jgi:hypothetical protein